MRLRIEGLSESRQRLARLRAGEMMAHALAGQAERLAATVRDGLGEPPGAGEHDRPWTRTGTLRDSVTARSNGLDAVVGSDDKAAAPQEMGTANVPPRPFLAPAAAAEAEAIAHAVCQAVVAALRGTPDPGRVAALRGTPDPGDDQDPA